MGLLYVLWSKNAEAAGLFEKAREQFRILGYPSGEAVALLNLADALLSALPAQRSVTSGAFDITVSSGLPALPTRDGSTMRATIEGNAWNGATIVALNPGAGTFSVSGSSTDYTFMVTPKQLIAAGNSYGIPSQISLTVSRTGTADSWAAISGPDIGSWTIDSFTAAGMSGSFSGTIPGLSVGTALSIEDGEFSFEFP